MALTAVVAIPLTAALLCWIAPLRKLAWIITLISTWTVLPLAVLVSAQVLANGRVIGLAGWIEADAFGALVLTLVSFVAALASVFAGGYMRRREHEHSRLWRFYCNYNLFAFALLSVP